MKQLDYKQLVVKQLAGEATAQEEAALKKWLAAAPENEAAFRDMQQVWQRTAPADNPKVPDIDAQWQKLEAKLGLQPQATIRAMPHKPSAYKIKTEFWGASWRRFAVAATVLIAVAGLSWWLGQNRAAQQLEVATGNAETRTVTLADGSVVTLNNDSKIRFRENLAGKERRIILSGEAYFDVAAAQRAFVVQTENARVRVLGTAFNIWARQRETRVIVSEGRVSLANAAEQTGDGVVLTADQMAVCRGDSNPESVLAVDSETAIGWRAGRIVFDETPLPEVVAELQRIYDAEIVLQDSALHDMSISGNFQQKPLAEVLDAICLTLGIRYGVEGGRHVLGE